MNKPSDVDDLVTELIIEVGARLIEMRTLFFAPEAVLTLIVRNPSSENGGVHLYNGHLRHTDRHSTNHEASR